MLNPCDNCEGKFWRTFETCICNLKILYDIEKNIPLDKKIIPIKKPKTDLSADRQANKPAYRTGRFR